MLLEHLKRKKQWQFKQEYTNVCVTIPKLAEVH